MTTVCGLLVVLLVATAARGADHVLAEQAASPARADGANTIAWFAAPGTLQLADARGTLTASVDVRDGCVEPPAQLDAAGGGQLLFRCATEHDFWFGRFPSDEPRLLDVAARAVHVPAGAVEEWYADLAEPIGSARFLDVGSHGVRMSAYTYRAGSRELAVDWRSGERVRDGTTPTTVLDPDVPGVVATLCDPLRRTRWDVPFDGVVEPPPYFDPLLYEPPYGISWGPRSPLTLQRCGDAARLVLEPRLPHDQMLSDVQLAGGVVSWLARDYSRSRGPETVPLRAYLPACGVRVEQPVTVAWSDDIVPQVAHVHDALVLSEQTDRDGPWRISRLSLSGVCAATRTAWSLAASAGGRSVELQAAVGATERLVNRGWRATQLAPAIGRQPRLAVRPGQTLRLRPGDRAHAIRWRLGAGRWHRLRTRNEDWRLTLPRQLGARRLELRVATRQGGEGRYRLHLAARG